ncbi:hypothetical protein APR12_002229 [Nocardia amikacinitolerans]|nr:hypothetical protein [Nocardia amikacinitolerans]
MRLLSAFFSLETKDKFTTSFAAITLIVSLVALWVAVGSRDISKEALAVSRLEAANVYRVTMNLIWANQQGGNVTTLVSGSGSPDEFPSDVFLSPKSWLQVEVTNIGNRPVTIYDIALIAKPEEGLGFWISNESYSIPDYCESETDSSRDVKCFSYPIVVAVGRSIRLLWQMSYWGPRLIEEAAITPIRVGINSRTGFDLFESTLFVR